MSFDFALVAEMLLQVVLVNNRGRDIPTAVPTKKSCRMASKRKLSGADSDTYLAQLTKKSCTLASHPSFVGGGGDTGTTLALLTKKSCTLESQPNFRGSGRETSLVTQSENKRKRQFSGNDTDTSLAIMTKKSCSL